MGAVVMAPSHSTGMMPSRPQVGGHVPGTAPSHSAGMKASRPSSVTRSQQNATLAPTSAPSTARVGREVLMPSARRCRELLYNR